jgi:hypothetical protein
LETDMQFNPGDSGWPLLSLSWEALWVIIATNQSQDVAWYVVPILAKEIESILNDIK